MTTIVSLRSMAIASNLLFILYGMLGDILSVTPSAPDAAADQAHQAVSNSISSATSD
jgi:hypothetical protein